MITKNNKEQQTITYCNEATSSFGLASPNASSDLASQPLREATASTIGQVAAPTPTLDKHRVERAVITFFDNGEKATQRYKLAVRLNLVDTDAKLSPEFIAPLSKDPRSFRRYAAPGTRDDLISFHNEIREYVKSQGIDLKPYFGKLHFNQTEWGRGRAKIQVEPWSYAAVWYTGDYWTGVIKCYDFILPFELFTDHITARQRQHNVKGTYLWQNPRYQRTQRPKTWGETQNK